MGKKISKKILDECKAKLLDKKAELLNSVTINRDVYNGRELSGDEADQSVAALAEQQFLTNQERLRFHLLEVESALARLERGTYGVCEETEEPIEVERLLAIPWTRLSIEGAEIRESMGRKYAR